MKTNFMKTQAVILSLTFFSIGTLAYSVKPNFNLAKFIEARAVAEYDDIFLGTRNMKLQNTKLAEQNDLQGGTVTVTKQYSNFQRKLSAGSAHYEDGYARESYHLRMIDGRAYRVLEKKQMSETRMPLSLSHPYLPDGGEPLWRIEGQAFSTGRSSDKSLMDGLKIEFRLSEHEKIQKRIEFKLDDSYPKGSEIIGYKSNKDLSRIEIQVLQNGKVVGYTFEVSGDKELSKLTRVATKELPLSDFYAGDVQPRAAVAVGSGVKGLTVTNGKQ